MAWQERVINSVDIERALSRLSPEEYSAVVQHYWGDQSYKEMAKQLGWDKWKPKKRVYEALCAIRTVWGVVLPERLDDAADATRCDSWWSLVLESMRRHIENRNQEHWS